MTPCGTDCFVVMDSWAGRTRHHVRIERICPVRVKVLWVAKTAFSGRRVKGECYYVPKSSLVDFDGNRLDFGR